MDCLNGAVSLPFFVSFEVNENNKKGCVIRSIFQIPITHTPYSSGVKRKQKK